MRTATSIRLLLLPAALVLAACEDSDSPFEPPAAPEPALPAAEAPAALAGARWADGYTIAARPTTASYTPEASYSYNRSGGRITIQRPAGSTGRYIVTFAGLSAKLGAKSTVLVTAAVQTSYCKPVNGTLVADKVEVRCYDTKGASINSEFTIVVLRKMANRAFAFANQPTNAFTYTPAAAGSYNPAGTIRVKRLYTGNYHVLFNGLGAKLGGKGGHLQVNAVGTNKAWCKTAEEWMGNPNLGVLVQCYTTGGTPVDAKFNVLFQLPSPHLAYAYANLSGVSSYTVSPFWSSNPGGGAVTVTRVGTGMFRVSWAGVDSHIIDWGTAQATALGTFDNSYCSIYQFDPEGAVVRCFAANGAAVDVPFTMLIGS
jgi:hypothetical protein